MAQRLNHDSSSSMKMLELYSLLVFSGRKHTLTKLAERLQCSKATVLRLMTDIELAEVIDTGKDGKERWFRINKLSKNPGKVFTHENIQQLVLCRDILFSLLPADLVVELGSTVDGAAELIPDKEIRNYALTPLARSCMKGAIDYTPFQSIITKIMQVIPKKRVCTVSYRSVKSKEIREFVVAPMRIMAYHESLYVECWRIKNENGQEVVQPMTLAVQRIKSFDPMLKRKHEFTEYPVCDEMSFGFMKQASERVRVHFDEYVSMYVSERRWSEDQEIFVLDDGSLELVLTIRSKDEFFSWVLSFGQFAEIVEPVELRSEFVEKIKNLVSVYS